MKETIGYRIRKLRELKDYTQDNMGAELGITAGAYAKIERDETDPSASRLMQIAEILGVDVTYFFSKISPSQLMQERLPEDYTAVSRQDILQLSAIIQSLQNEIAGIKSELAILKKSRIKK